MKISRGLENVTCQERIKKTLKLFSLEETGGRHGNSFQIQSRQMGRGKESDFLYFLMDVTRSNGFEVKQGRFSRIKL